MDTALSLSSSFFLDSVIQFSVEQKEKTLLEYSVARFARLYSVVIPALALTLVCDLIGSHHNPSIYFMDRETIPALRLALASLFLTENWHRLSLLSNASFWSLPYEFWYYQIFAAAIFLKGWWRLAMVFLGSAIAGPAILLLFPIWLFGAMAYRLMKKIRIPWAGLVWSISTLGILAAIVKTGDLPVRNSMLVAHLRGPFSIT